MLALPCMHQGDRLDGCWACMCTERNMHHPTGGSLAQLLWPAWPVLQAQVMHSGTECRCSAKLLHHAATALMGPQSTTQVFHPPCLSLVSPHRCTLPCGFLVRPVPAGETPHSAMELTALVRPQSLIPQAVSQNALLFLVACYWWLQSWLWYAGFSQPSSQALREGLCSLQAIKTLLCFPVGDTGG